MLADLDFDWIVGNKEFWAIIVGFLGTVFTIRQQTSVMQTQVALEFFRRYADIMNQMPDRLRLAKYGGDIGNIGAEERGQMLRSMIQYGNLCSEEYALYTQGRVPRDIWRIWVDGIAENFESPIWRLLWADVAIEYRSYEPFAKFMDEVIAHAASKSSREVTLRS
jgi:hypothetical protein